MIGDIIFKSLIADDAAEIWDRLGKWTDADGEQQPAIYQGEIPDNAAFPAIVINEAGGSDWGDRARRGAVLNIDVQVFGHRDSSRAEIRALAREIWNWFNRLDLSEWEDGSELNPLMCQADPPMATNDDLGFPGFTVRLRVTVMEKE